MKHAPPFPQTYHSADYLRDYCAENELTPHQTQRMLILLANRLHEAEKALEETGRELDGRERARETSAQGAAWYWDSRS